MKVTLVSPGYEPDLGGVETHVTEIARRLAAHCEVEVLAQRTGPGRPALEVRDGVCVRRFAVPVASTNYAVAPGLWRHLLRHGRESDIVHGHNYHALPALAAAAGARPGRLVLTPHYHGAGSSPLRDALHRVYRVPGTRMLRRAARVVCVSHVERELLVRDVPAVAPACVVIPNGVDSGALQGAQPFATDGPVLLAAGRLEPHKRVDRLVEAAAHLPAPWSLRIAGDGPAAAELEALAHRAGLQDRVQLLGRVALGDLHRWYKTAAVFASLSEQESFGLTVAEALAAGTPVVASDIPAHRELADRLDGVSLAPASAAAPELAALVVATAGTQPGPRRPEDWNAVAAHTLELYREVVA